MKIFKFIIILLIISLISLENVVYKCRSTNTDEKVEIGDEVILCIHVPELKRKVAFKLKVDEYSVISIENGFNKIILPKEQNNLGRLLIEEEPTNKTSDDELIEEVQFVGQIGNITSAYPSVSFLIIYIILNFFINIDILSKN